MKILIFYASYGGGHLNAAKSIHECLKNNYKDKNIDVELIDCVKYINKTIEKMTTKAYNEMAKKAPWAWGRIYSDSQKGPLAHITSRSNKIMAIKLLRLLREKQPDLIISTHPFGSQMCSYLKRKGKISAKIATIMTDFAPHDQWLVGSDFTDYYFVAHENMKKYLKRKGIPDSKIFATGIPLSSKFLKNFNKEKIFKELNLKPDKKTILFFGGGEFGLGKTRTVEIFEGFVKYCKNMQMLAISGKNEKMKLAFEKVVSRHRKKDSILVFEYTSQVPEFMSISDLVVTKPGGLTTTESLASHLPMVIINPIPGQEEKNAKFLVKNGIAIWIKKQDNVEETLKNLFSHPETLETMKENTQKLAKLHSTKDICDILLKN